MASFSFAGFSAGPVAMVIGTTGRDELEFGGTTATVMCLSSCQSALKVVGGSLVWLAIPSVQPSAGEWQKYRV